MIPGGHSLFVPFVPSSSSSFRLNEGKTAERTEGTSEQREREENVRLTERAAFHSAPLPPSFVGMSSDTKKINAEKEAAARPTDNDLPPTDWMPFVAGTENARGREKERKCHRCQCVSPSLCLTVGTFHRAKRLLRPTERRTDGPVLFLIFAPSLGDKIRHKYIVIKMSNSDCRHGLLLCVCAEPEV